MDAEVAAAAPVRTGPAGYDAVLAADVIVRSPVIGQTHPWILEARRRGIVVTGGTALWMAEHAERTIGITGSKGKSTTTTLVHHLLTALGRPNVLGGNIGVAALSLPGADLYVLELSAYQCADLDDSPHIAAVTSLYPEHLDWSGSEENYYRDKLRILATARTRRGQRQRRTGQRPTTRVRTDLPVLATGRPDNFHVAAGPDGTDWIRPATNRCSPGPDLPWWAGTMKPTCASPWVCCTALASTVSPSGTRWARQSDEFKGLSHRLEPIADPSGLTFVDDSISTIPQSTIHAIEAYSHLPLTVLVGGEDRGVDYTPLHDFLADGRSSPPSSGYPTAVHASSARSRTSRP